MNPLPDKNAERLIKIFSFIVIGLGLAVFFKPIHSDAINIAKMNNISFLEIRFLILAISLFLGRAFFVMKIWSRPYLILFFLICIDFVYLPIIFFGSPDNEWESRALLIVFISSGIFIFNSRIKINFQSKKKHTWICGALALLFGFKAILAFAYNFYWSYKYGERPFLEQKIVKLENYKDVSDSFHPPLTFGPSFKTPNGMRLRNIRGREKDGRGLYLFRQNECEGDWGKIVWDEFDVLTPLKEALGSSESVYSLTKRMLIEKRGLFFKIYRELILPNPIDRKIQRIYETRINGFSLFIVERINRQNRKGKSFYTVEVFVFKGLNFLAKIETKSENILFASSIIRTLMPQKPEFKSNSEYFQKGLKLYKENDFEKAKLYLAYAVLNDWKNPDFHFYLGKAFLEDNLLHSAEKHFDLVQKIKSDYQDANDLLKEAKKKKKVRDCYDNKTRSYIPFKPI